MNDNQNLDNSGNADIVAIEIQPKSYLVEGLATVGNATGLIYGLTMAQNKRWWAVILYMAAGGILGSGIGYVIKSGQK